MISDSNGVLHPSREHLRRYQSWQPGHGMLGRNAQEKIERIIREFMQQKHDECVGSKAAMAEFVGAHDELLDQCWSRIEAYEAAATEFRSKPQVGVDGRTFQMRRFDWFYESEEVVRSLLRKKKNQSILPLSALEKEARAMFQTTQAEASIWRQEFRSKVDAERRLYSQFGGLAPPGERLNRMESAFVVIAEVAQRLKASGVFNSVRNTKVK